jgi:hypothetical protein
MCIWIDENAYKEGCNEELLFEYLYHISRMLAYKRRFFERADYYDDFAIFMATRIFMRLKNKKQFSENSKLDKIRSVLNYAKSILYSSKVQFEELNYAQNYVSLDEKDVPYDYSLHDSIISTVDDLSISDFKVYLGDMVKTARGFLYKLPHKDKAEIDNIYTSCMLSFLNSVVLSNKNKEKMKNLIESGRLTPEHIDKIYKSERDNSIILYHIDQSMKPYITVLVNELRHLFAKDLTTILNDRTIQSEANIKSMLISSANLDINFSD